MHPAPTPSAPAGIPSRPQPGGGTDPLLVLLARAAEGDEAAGRAFYVARAARVRMGDRLTEQSRATAFRMLRRFDCPR